MAALLLAQLPFGPLVSSTMVDCVIVVITEPAPSESSILSICCRSSKLLDPKFSARYAPNLGLFLRKTGGVGGMSSSSVAALPVLSVTLQLSGLEGVLLQLTDDDPSPGEIEGDRCRSRS